MPHFRDLKTHGSIFDALKPYQNDALAAARKNYGTSTYFTSLDIEVHKAFDTFCCEYGMTPGESAMLLDVLKKHAAAYPHLNDSFIRTLCSSLPQEFNVRGAWTSQRAVVTVE